MVVPAPRAWYLPLLVGLLASLAAAEWPVSSPCKPYASGAARYVHVSNLTALKVTARPAYCAALPWLLANMYGCRLANQCSGRPTQPAVQGVRGGHFLCPPVQNALSNAKAGDLIEMEEGTYAHATHDDMGFDKKNGAGS